MVTLTESMERDLLPFPDTIHWSNGNLEEQVQSTAEKVAYYVNHAAQFLFKLALVPLVATLSGVRLLATRFIAWFNKPEGKIESTPVEKVELASVLPSRVGGADSLFQTSGLGTRYSATPLEGECFWNKNLNAKHIEGNPDFDRFFIDVLGDPDRFIAILKEMNFTAYRLSLEWAVLETTPGVFNSHAISLYKTLLAKMIEAGIEPCLTIHHYNHPQWFEERGAFHQTENIELFKNHVLKMMELFPEVTHWYTFNEVGGFGLETLLGDFPGSIKGDHAATGRMVRNILMAHCKTYQAVKEKYGDRVQLGITHQFLDFVPVTGNFVEELVCRHFAKVSHRAVYDFFKTGEYSFEFPGMSNVHFSIPKEEFEKNKGFLDCLGVQAYGNARFIFAFNGGKPYPGPKLKNFSFGPWGFSAGVTCEDGKRVSSFGPEIDPATLERCLKEAAALKHPIEITEIGCDAKSQSRGEEIKIDRETQKKYFEEIAPILEKFKEQIRAFYVWTVYSSNALDQPGQLEWNRGAQTKLGIVEITQGPDRRIAAHKLTPAAKFIQDQFLKMRQYLPEFRIASSGG